MTKIIIFFTLMSLVSTCIITGSMGIVIGPSEVQNINLERQGSSIVLSWDAPGMEGSSPILGYKVYRDGVEIANLSFSKLSHVDEDVDLTIEHTYSVLAFNEEGDGASVTINYEVPKTDDGYLYLAATLIVFGSALILVWLRRKTANKD
jgi:hypothetical protein